MAYAEKRGNLWRARWRGPDGALESKPGFQTRKAAENYAVTRKPPSAAAPTSIRALAGSRSPSGSTSGTRLST